MSEQKKSKHVLLIVLAVAALLAVCFASVGLYAKNEMNKPRFTLPAQTAEPSVSPLPQEAQAAADYVLRLYTAAVSADDVEGSWHTDVNLDGESQITLFAGEKQIVDLIRAQAGGQIAALYPTAENVNMAGAENPPVLPALTGAFDLKAAQGVTDEAGNVTDEQYYFITFSVDPAGVDTAAMQESAVLQGVREMLAPAAAVDALQITAQSVTLSARIDRVTDQLLSLDITRTFSIDASVTMTDAYRPALSASHATAILPYETTEHISFTYYGARFADRAMVAHPKDMKALPAIVTVNSEATKADYALRFEISDPSLLTIDADGVMTVGKEIVDAPVTVTMTLNYHGHTYTDQLLVYITELEVETTDG